MLSLQFGELPTFRGVIGKLRWAISEALNRDIIAEIAWEGLTKPAEWLTADYPTLTQYNDKVVDLFKECPTTEYNLAKSASIMKELGYTKDSANFWIDKTGKRIKLELVIREGEADQAKMAPVVAQLLKRGGFDASFQLADIATFTDALNSGRANAFLDVACGGVQDPYATLESFHSRHAAPNGRVATGFRVRWKNADLDKVVDQMAITDPTDPKMFDLYRQAMQIWLPELPAIPLVQATLLSSLNTTYWKNWPTSTNNYIQPDFWWATALMMIMNIQRAQ